MRDRRINNLPIFLARVAEVGLEGSGQAQRKTVLRLARDCGEAWLGEPVDGRDCRILRGITGILDLFMS